MSANKHRQPLVNWSSVLLLSTLLLSPMTAGALLHALAQAFPRAFAASIADEYPTTASAGDAGRQNNPASTRRANDEQEAVRESVSRDQRLRADRLETDPHALLSALILGGNYSTRVAQADSHSVSKRRASWPDIADSRLRLRLIVPVPPRAPPV